MAEEEFAPIVTTTPEGNILYTYPASPFHPHHEEWVEWWEKENIDKPLVIDRDVV